MAYWAKNGKIYPYKETRAQYEERKEYETKKNNNITVINSLYRSISVKNPFVIVSAVIDETIVSYPVEWGCPYTGEPVYRITCTRNPKFDKSPEVFRSAIIYNVEELKKELKQSTVTVTESKVKMMYFTNDNESEGN